MGLVILQPTGSKVSRIHYNDTINTAVDLDKIKTYIPSDLYKKLLEIYPDKKVHAWGVTPGKNNVNGNKWNRINAGDITFFSANKVLFTSGTIAMTIHNKGLAKELWGTNDENETWEYMYFLDNIKNHEIKIESINELIGYKDNYVVQGFTVLDEEKSQKIINAYNFYTEKYHSSTNKNLIEEKLKKLIGTGTDIKRNTNSRREQKLLRDYLFEAKYKCKCQICNEEYPVEFLHTAHIKKRQFCDDNERLDFKNIVMPVCKFGCDDLFEKGFIVVDNGTVRINKMGNTDFFNEKLDGLNGNECRNWNDENKKYFEWHLNYHNFR